MNGVIEDGIAAAMGRAGVPVRTYHQGAVVFVKDDEADCAYVVKTGRVEIREKGRVLESIGPGEIFGEVGMIDRGRRSASAVAIEPTEVHMIDREAFDRLVRGDAEFSLAIMRDLARRLRSMNAHQSPPTGLPLAPGLGGRRSAG
ncbi:MAG: Crp/Fnr family transcriptional regulator [Bauldia sp.]|uniref:Crp/Fnr family transcriptional regulator n=1 Tax=Bauldia sp. TaxID=2575872 RepID=UPI001DE684F4|nr:Crp/Fnr family transcriptional regulator [Bauldia sp.]MCB1494789.1 Crp/Fnr family transcriptional regulator [Bauldia sp.]